MMSALLIARDTIGHDALVVHTHQNCSSVLLSLLLRAALLEMRVSNLSLHSQVRDVALTFAVVSLVSRVSRCWSKR